MFSRPSRSRSPTTASPSKWNMAWSRCTRCRRQFRNVNPVVTVLSPGTSSQCLLPQGSMRSRSVQVKLQVIADRQTNGDMKFGVICRKEARSIQKLSPVSFHPHTVWSTCSITKNQQKKDFLKQVPEGHLQANFLT